jgi:hypothetical protein
MTSKAFFLIEENMNILKNNCQSFITHAYFLCGQ